MVWTRTVRISNKVKIPGFRARARSKRGREVTDGKSNVLVSNA